MWKKKILYVILVLISLVTLTGFNPQLQTEDMVIRITQVDTTDFPKVTVYVAVTDSEGDPIGLDPARIQLKENDLAIPLDQIEGAGEIDPLTVLLAVDISGSMLYAKKLEAAKAAAKVFVEQLRPADRIGLLAFHTEIFYVQPITANRELILDAIDNLQAEEDTVMYDALLEGIQILSDTKGRKGIVAITDGLDTLSTSTPETVLETIGPAGLSISIIGLGDPDQDLGEYSAIDEQALQYLAENAGGVYAYANDQDSLSEVYQSYATAFKSEYQLTYTSPSSLRDGVNRALSVSIADVPNSSLSVEENQSLVYNPGGLVPEVAEPVPMGVFGGVLAGLVLLLFAPTAVKPILSNISSQKTPEKKKTRIKLKD